LQKIWKQREKANADAVKKLVEDLNAPEVIAEILCQRGIDTSEKVKKFYNPRIGELHDPFLMKDMEQAIDRINHAISNQEGVLIFGDYDVDGTTSVALAYSFFKNHFSHCEYYIPDRYKEGYGISKEGIDYAKTNNHKLIIALDCGIRSVELVDYATTLGIDFIICDHHLPGDEIPNAAAVLDPKQQDCEYPFKELSGCGVGFKLTQAFSEVHSLDDMDYLQYLDLVTLSIASDIVPIIGENRILAHFGLKLINSNPRLGVQKLIEVALNKDELGIGDLVFYLGPRINAAGRMGDAKGAVKMLTSESTEEAQEWAQVLHQQNLERRSVDEKITEDFKEIVHQNPELLEHKTLVFYKDDWHKGVVGIAASRAIELYYRPTIVLTKSGDVLAGSARSISGFDVHAALQECKEHLIQFGGHTHAAGMTLHINQLDNFRNAFEEVGKKWLTDEILTPKVYYDSKLDIKLVGDGLLKAIQRMAPFGPGNLTPVFYSNNLEDHNGKIIGKTAEHIRLNVKRQNGELAAVGFGMASQFNDIKKADSFEACFQINENIFNGYRSIQLMLKDIKPTSGA
jgi:single-stranded-DNA-specific exonuclease